MYSFFKEAIALYLSNPIRFTILTLPSISSSSESANSAYIFKSFGNYLISSMISGYSSSDVLHLWQFFFCIDFVLHLVFQLIFSGMLVIWDHLWVFLWTCSYQGQDCSRLAHHPFEFVHTIRFLSLFWGELKFHLWAGWTLALAKCRVWVKKRRGSQESKSWIITISNFNIPL